MNLKTILFAGLTLIGSSILHAGGLDGIAVSSDGTKVFVGGESRVLFFLDGDLAVQQRVWFESQIKTLALAKNDSVLIVHDDDQTVKVLDANSLEEVKRFEKVMKFGYTPGDPAIVMYQGSYSDAGIKVVDLENFEITSSGALPEKVKPDAVGFDPATGGAVAISAREKNEETKISSSGFPKELKGIDRDRFEQENDAYGARLLRYAKDGTLESNTPIAYQSGTKPILAKSGDEMILVNYDDENMRIKSDGGIELFEVGAIGYGRAVLGDIVVLGSLRKGNWITGDGTKVEFELDKLPGFPEYFAAFAKDAKGAIYGSTSAYRVGKFGTDGKVISVVPVY